MHQTAIHSEGFRSLREVRPAGKGFPPPVASLFRAFFPRQDRAGSRAVDAPRPPRSPHHASIASVRVSRNDPAGANAPSATASDDGRVDRRTPGGSFPDTCVTGQRTFSLEPADGNNCNSRVTIPTDDRRR